MDGTELAMAAALGLVASGIFALLGAEAAGLPTAVVAACGAVTLVGVGVLTAAVARVPEASGENQHGA
ncbi:hypothetical protein [Halobellus sp. GM3]|uniref:hypothetical protein n=1 Tax=Halobellus sp. GM3 TaxID=3458410 RepID=UPI00403D9B24